MYLYTSFDLMHRWSTKFAMHVVGYASQHKSYQQEATQLFFSIFTGSQAVCGTVSEKIMVYIVGFFFFFFFVFFFEGRCFCLSYHVKSSIHHSMEYSKKKEALLCLLANHSISL